MADEAEQVSQDTSAEQTAGESQTQEQTNASHETSDGASGEQADKGQSASTGDNSKSENQDSKPDSKPLSRRSAAYRIQQLVRENTELKRQQGKPVQQEQNEWDEDTATDDQGNKPDIAALVAKEVERRLNPIVSESSKAADDAELGELFSGDKASERAKYEPKIREMWKLPQYKDVAAQDLYKIASFDDAVSTAVSKAIEDYKTAQKEAKDSSASGTSNSNRTGKGGKSINDLSDAEFAARNERIKAGLPV